jgi:hypothetical protein
MNPKELARFEDKIVRVPESGCWMWAAALDRYGYGHVKLSGRLRASHRVSYEHHIGEIPAGMQIDHLCRVRCCVNPAHLEAVTHQENVRRGNGGCVNAAKTHCAQGHKFSESNTYYDRLGRRRCRECSRNSARARRIKHQLRRK